jgi:hypothetical protein
MTHRRGGILALLLALCLMALCPAAALAQASAPPSPGQAAGASAGPAGAAGAAQPSAATKPSGEAQPAAASAAPAASGASAPAVRAVPTPVGGNLTEPKSEPVSIFAWLLIALAAIWFIAAIIGIIRLLSRPRAYAAAMPPAEQDRTFLTFIMPFAALVTVFAILSAFGLLFLWLARISPKMFDTEIYPLIVDLVIVCGVMFLATVAALKSSGGQHQTEVH